MQKIVCCGDKIGKRIIIFCVLFIAAAVLAGCSKQKEEPVETAGTIGEYWPVRPNTLYEYKGVGHEGMRYDSYIAIENGNRIQRRIDHMYGTATEVLEFTDTQVTCIYGDGYYYFYEDITQSLPNQDIIVLQEPLTLGHGWSSQVADDDGNMVTISEAVITDTAVEVTVPYGTFSALEVTITDPDGKITKEYYAKGIGLVKKEITTNGETLSSELKTITEETGIGVSYEYFDANAVTGEQDITARQLRIQTNGGIIAQLEEEMRDAHSGDNVPLMPQSARIKSFSIDRKTASIVINFSKEFTEDSELDDDLQILALQCIVNTFGRLYDVDRIMITVEEKPFEYGTIKVNAGDYFQVDHGGEDE